jgi:uncharacterized membrane protein/nitrite reductase/ring-hydroxylating ferredoxin subunit
LKSKANIKGHPIHPILVAFPIAFFSAVFFLDLFQLLTGSGLFSHVTFYLEAGGIVFALLAAIPGIIDYCATVPPGSSAKRRATRHGLLNVGMLLAFTAALLLRLNSEFAFVVIVLIEALGFVIMSVAGWMGGTLVYRNQIGVDHRYARAGKWKDVTIRAKGRVELKDLDKLRIDQLKLYKLNGRRVVIGRTETGFVAFDDFCTHRGGSLADGVMICGTVQCPWHGSQFDVNTGAVKAGPAKNQVKCYSVVSSEGKHYIEV